MSRDIGLVSQLVSKEIRNSRGLRTAIRILADIGCVHRIVSMIVKEKFAIKRLSALGTTVFHRPMAEDVMGAAHVDALVASLDRTGERFVCRQARVTFQLMERSKFQSAPLVITYQGQVTGSLTSGAVYVGDLAEVKKLLGGIEWSVAGGTGFSGIEHWLETI